MLALLRRVLPWIVAALLLWLLFRRAGSAEVLAAVRQADVMFLVGATVLCTLPMYVLDVVTLRTVVSWFNCPTSWREIAPLQAAIYLLKAVNFNAGSGGIALWLNRHKGVPFLEAAGSVLFVNVVDALLLVAFMAWGLPALEPPLQAGVRTIVIVAGLALAGNLLYWRGGFDFLVLGRFRTWSIFNAFHRAQLSRYLELALMRAPFLLFFIINQWLGLKAFDIDVPFLEILVFVPLLSFIATVPVTVAGLGTVQAATLFLFAPYASEARLLAYSLVLVLVLNGVRALFGLPVFGRVSGEVLRGGKN